MALHCLYQTTEDHFSTKIKESLLSSHGESRFVFIFFLHGSGLRTFSASWFDQSGLVDPDLCATCLGFLGELQILSQYIALPAGGPSIWTLHCYLHACEPIAFTKHLFPSPFQQAGPDVANTPAWSCCWQCCVQSST